MKRMKRWIAILGMFCLLFSFSACDKDDKDEMIQAGGYRESSLWLYEDTVYINCLHSGDWQVKKIKLGQEEPAEVFLKSGTVTFIPL